VAPFDNTGAEPSRLSRDTGATTSDACEDGRRSNDDVFAVLRNGCLEVECTPCTWTSARLDYASREKEISGNKHPASLM
jgi:hypothetical protein